MGKLTDSAIRSWIKAGERFEARGDGCGLALAFRGEFRERYARSRARGKFSRTKY